jgi:hypothetical protein
MRFLRFSHQDLNFLVDAFLQGRSYKDMHDNAFLRQYTPQN